jgi:hypothetical protein
MLIIESVLMIIILIKLYEMPVSKYFYHIDYISLNQKEIFYSLRVLQLSDYNNYENVNKELINIFIK